MKVNKKPNSIDTRGEGVKTLKLPSQLEDMAEKIVYAVKARQKSPHTFKDLQNVVERVVKNKLICFLEELWNDMRFMPPAPISGHQYDDPDNREYFTDRVVCVDKCSRCGEVSITHFSKEMYEEMKAKGAL